MTGIIASGSSLERLEFVLLNKNYVKLILDVVIAVIFTLLFNVRVLGGLPFHEIAGLGIGIGFLAHILLNSQWVKTVTIKLFDRKLQGKTRFGYLLNLFLLISMVATIGSGLMISKIIFPGSRSIEQHWFVALHQGVSYFMLILVGMHVGLHWQWIAGMLKKVFRFQSQSLPRVIAIVALVLAILYGTFQILDSRVAPQIAQLGKNVISENFRGEFEGKEFSREKHGAITGVEIGDPSEGFSEERGELGEGQNTKGDFRTVSSAGVVLKLSGIIGLFAFITHSVEKLRRREELEQVK